MVLIIAEAGVNHNGNISIAKELVNAAKECGADVVKFQSFNANNLVTPTALKAPYQIRNTLNKDPQISMLKKLELTFEEQIELKEYCDNKKIEFLSTAFELESLFFLKDIKLRRFKIPSGEITNLPYLKVVGSFKKPIILSTGMSNLTEIRDALMQLIKAGTKKEDITILHCTTDYPAKLQDINLKAMDTIKKAFNVDIGYSDHTLGIEVSLAAVALGAKIIEKHLTLDKKMEGPDHKSSLEPNEFLDLVKGTRNISKALGTNQKKISKSELKNLNLVRKSIVAKIDIKKGELLTSNNLCTKRPGNGITPMKWEQLMGTVAKRNFKANDFITFN